MTPINDYQGTPLTDLDLVFDLQEGKHAVIHITKDESPWLQWEDGGETWLLDPSMLVKENFNVLAL